jgi:Ku70/Ku80 beta-barrel domain
MIPGTGEEIEKREVVKGYEYSRGQFLTFTAEELKALDVESSKVIDLEKFAPRNDIDPVYFDSSYYLHPDGPIAVETPASRRIGPRGSRSHHRRIAAGAHRSLAGISAGSA